MKHKCSICNGTEEHSFAYESVENGNAIKATCSDCGATYTVKLTQPAAKSDEKIVYDGTEKKAGTTIDSGNTGIETIPENAITYAAVTNGTTSTYSTAAPKNAGTYKAKLTLGTGDNRVSIEINFTIEKAASPTIAGEEKSYAYSVGSDGKTIGVDIAGKLPTDRGTTTYAVAKTDTEQLLSEVAVDTAGNLTYKVNQVDSSKVGKTAIITVTASMENYENVEYTLTIRSITDKKTVEIKRGNTVSVDGSNVLTYGEKVSKLTLGNTVFVEAGTDNMVEGILSWSNPDEVPATGTTQAGWVFKPADSKHYEDLTGTAAITVAKATPIVVTVPTVAEREYNPDAALTGSDMTGGSVTGADGNSLAGTWSFTGTNIVPTVNNTGYQAVFTPNDTNNYNTVTRTITVKVTKATPVIAEKPTAGALTYGQKLSDSTLTGGKAAYQTADGTEITGTFAWKNDTTKPAVVDSQKTEYDVTFTPSDKDNYNAVDTKLTLSINKAAAPTMQPIELTVINGLAKTYLVNLPALPTLGDNCKYGSIKYEACNFDLIGEGGYANSTATITSNDEFQLTVPAVESQTEGSVGTVGVKITTDNYQDMLLTVEVIAKNKIVPVPDGEITATPITFGQILRVSNITGTMKGDGKPVEGTFEWTDPSTKPDKAGNYQAEWTFTPAEGYEEYAPATGTVTIKVNKATPTFTAPTAQENLTYTGQEQALITAGMTDHGTMQYSLTENGTYSQDIPTGTDAGAYTVWYRVIGDANHNDTAPASVAVSIGKKPLTITGVTAASKPYDGTTNADISSVTFDNVTLNRGTDYTVTASFDDAGVGSGKNVTATVTLMGQAARNYALEQSSFPATGSITKAAAPTNIPTGTLNVINGTYQTYTYDFSKLLPELSEGEYGTISYGNQADISLVSQSGYYYDESIVEFKNGVLTLAQFYAKDGKMTGQIGTVKVKVTTTNYETFELTLVLNAVNRITPVPDDTSTITASEITYGDELSASTITGTMKDPNTGYAVNGTFAWTDGTIKPDANDSYEAEWTFTPKDGNTYTEATGKVTVKVAPKSIEGATITLEKREFTYNAEEQSPKITGVTLEGWSETITTYDIVSGDKAINANDSIPLTIKGIGNYTGTATAKWKIIPAELTVSVQSVEKAYDGTTNATVTPTFNGLQGGENLTAADYSVTAAFEDAKVGYKKLVTGKVTLNQTDTAKNYLLKNDGTFSTGEGTIKKADAPTVQPVELTIYNDVQKDYFVDLPPLPELGEGKSYGTVNYNNPHAINLSEGYTAQSTLVADPENLKTYRLLLRMNQTGSLTEEIGTVTIPVTTSNYQDITLTVKVNAVNQITPVPDDGTITATPITYGNELSASTITGTMQDPNTRDAVNGTFTWVTPAEKLKAGSHNAKWIFTPDESNGGKYTTNIGTATVTVNPKAVTVSGITANDKVYDGTTNAGLDYSAVTLGGVLENDTLTVTATGTLESAGVGEQQKVKISNFKLGGNSAANYVLAESGNQTETTATITAKEVIVTITPNGGTYGSVVAAAAKLSGAVDGENVPVTLTYIGNNYSSATVPVNVGSYTVTASIANRNYTLTGKTTADFVITPKAVTVSGITANDKVYDGNTNAVLDYSKVVLDGVLDNDTLTVTATGKLESADVGEKKVTISDLTLGGNSAANYVLAESGNQTETTANITAKQITVTITPNGGTYGSVVAAAAKLSGAVDGENVPVTLTYIGNNYSSATVPVNVGSYTVTASIANRNYTLTGKTTADFVITPKAVTVSGITANDKVYDGNTNAVLDYSKVVLDGVLDNDTLTVTATGKLESADVGEQKVTISDLTLGGNSANNYVLAESGNQTETIATITAKEVTVTPDNKSKVYEEKDPKLTYIVSGVLSGETLTGITLTRAEGENAGEYDITGTADAGANPNYDVTFAKGTFTIKPKSIQSATVVLGKGLTANGAEQTQTVEKVLLVNKELPADSYTVSGNTATAHGIYTLTVTGKGNYKDSVKWTYVIAPAKAEDAPGEDIAIGRGKVKVDVQSEGTVPPATLLTDKAELLAMLVNSGDITADELVQIANGASVDIVLTVKEANVPDVVKTAMAQAAKGYTIGQYLDISLFKYMTVNGNRQPGAALHTTKNALPISVVVPDALIHTDSAVNRNYCIVRCHEGAIAVLDAAFDAANKTLTFKTDRFSVYAIAYKDTAVPSSGSNPGSNNSSNDSETKKNEVAPTPAPTPTPTQTPANTAKPSTITAMPQTGDTFNPTLYVVLLVASLLGLAVVFVCKKRNDK